MGKERKFLTGTIRWPKWWESAPETESRGGMQEQNHFHVYSAGESRGGYGGGDGRQAAAAARRRLGKEMASPRDQRPSRGKETFGPL